MARNIKLFTLILFSVLVVQACNAKKERSQHKLSSTATINQYIKKANEYDNSSLLAARDSTIINALEYALLQGNDTDRVKIYAAYFSYSSINLNPSKEYAQNLMDLAKSAFNNEWFYYAWVARAKIETLETGDFKLASAAMEKAYHYVLLTNNESEKANCLLAWGYYLENSNRKLDAFNGYQQALYMAEKLNDDNLKLSAYHTLSDFYVNILNNERALEYKQKELQLLGQAAVIDSVTYMTAMMDMSAIFFYKNERSQAELFFHKAMQYAIRTNNLTLKKYGADAHISYLFEHNFLQDIASLYEGTRKNDMADLRKHNPMFYYRIVSCINEVRGDMDTANMNYNNASAILSEEEYSFAYITNFYVRYGQFLLRYQKPSLAKNMFDTAYTYAKKSGYMPFLAQTTHYLDSLNHAEKNYIAAYQFSQLSQQYRDSITIQNKADDVLRSEIEYEMLQKNLMIEKEQKAINRRHNLQYMALTLGLLASFILLAALGTFKVHPGLIRAMGFFSFIFFFEFIILLADNQIHHYTHGEPWKIMAIKIVLIGILLPLHHSIEHKVVHFLSTHKIIDTAKWSFRFWKKKPINDNTKK